MGNMQDMYCSKFSAELDGVIAILEGIHTSMEGLIKSLQKLIDKLQIPSLSEDIQDAMDQLNVDLTNEIPGSDSFNELAYLARVCGLIEEDLSLKGELGLKFDFGTALNNIFNDILEAYNTTLESLLEYPVAQFIDTINQFITSSNIKGIVDQIGKYEDCVEALCGAEIRDKVTTCRTLISDGFITISGEKFDHNSYYDSIGLEASFRTNIETCLNQINSSKEEAATAIDTISKGVGALGL